MYHAVLKGEEAKSSASLAKACNRISHTTPVPRDGGTSPSFIGFKLSEWSRGDHGPVARKQRRLTVLYVFEDLGQVFSGMVRVGKVV